MTKRQLYNWILEHGCKQHALPNQTTMRLIYFENPRTGGYATLNIPIDDKEMYPNTIVAICVSLNIELPPKIE
jgi:hypothetical protein